MDRLFSAGMLVARTLLSGIFLFSGVKQVFAFSATQGYMAQHGMKMTGLFLVLAILLEVGGGLSVLLGYLPRLGALVLLLFLVPTTAVFHRDFANPAQERGDHGRPGRAPLGRGGRVRSPAKEEAGGMIPPGHDTLGTWRSNMPCPGRNYETRH